MASLLYRFLIDNLFSSLLRYFMTRLPADVWGAMKEAMTTAVGEEGEGDATDEAGKEKYRGSQKSA